MTLRLVSTEPIDSDLLTVHLSIEFSPSEVEVMAPGEENYVEQQEKCAEWTRNFLAPELQRMRKVLAWRLQ